jgi:glutathione S-transferase
MAQPVTIYGIPRSRAFRNLWAAEEAGVDYVLEPTDFVTGVKAPAFAALNPNAKIPAMKDGALVLWESLAINLYIARKFGEGLWPATVEDEGRAFMWTLWTATELEPIQMQWAYNSFIRPPEQRDAALAAAGAEGMKKPFGVLETVLAAGGPYLLGKDFTIADLNVASVAYSAWFNKWDFTAFPRVKAWLETCLERPAAKRARNMREAA